MVYSSSRVKFCENVAFKKLLLFLVKLLHKEMPLRGSSKYAIVIIMKEGAQ